MSMVWKLYSSYAQPSVRIVPGIPLSWDSNVAIIKRPFTIGLVAWSSSSRFIAITQTEHVAIDILDSTTLQRVQSLGVPRQTVEYPGALTFSPDGRMLSCTSSDYQANGFVSTWDLQTGGLASSVRVSFWERESNVRITYSMNGRVVGVLYRDSEIAIISIIDVFSGVLTHDFRPYVPWTYDIWAHGESLRIATAEEKTITIWEVGFTKGATQRKIETLPVPDDADQEATFDPTLRAKQYRLTQFFPIPCRLAFTCTSQASADELLVWGPRNSVSLLHDTSASWYPRMTFSSDGRFFACSTAGREVYLWKESSAGYTLIGKLQSNTRRSIPLLSPDGKSVITFGDRTIQLWHTKASTTPSSISTHVPHFGEDFVLDFVPDRQLAVVARRGEETVTVLDLKSGLPQLTIDASMEVYGLRVAGNAVVVIGDGMVITWNLPEGDFPPHARVGTENSIQTKSFSGGGQSHAIAASISLDFRYIAVLRTGGFPTLHAYRLSTGHNFYDTFLHVAGSLLFAPSGLDIWCAAESMVESHPIDQEEGILSEFDIEDGPCGSPWKPSLGCTVTNDGWLIGPKGKRLFLLPPPWRSYAAQRLWNGQFLALLHGSLPQAVILDLTP